jgi:hypothetical protein
VGHAVARLVEALRYKPEGRGFEFRWCHLGFFIDNTLPATLGSKQPLTEMSTRNISWEVNTANAYHLRVPIVLKSGSLNLLERSGPVLACIRIALPLLWE